MILHTTKDFQRTVLQHMTFTPHPAPHYTLYKNDNHPELGYFIKYSREGYYDLGIGDYTIASNFTLSFKHQEEFIRFGTVYTGETSFTIANSPMSSFTPSSFFVVEKNLAGQQTWERGMHFHGVEITLYKKYFDEVIHPNFPDTIQFEGFITNYTYRYLPLEVARIIQQLGRMAEMDKLSLLYLESKILECLALLSNEINTCDENVFTNQIDYGKVKIGKDRELSLTASDVHAIQKAHAILTKEVVHPPTIKALSKMVFLNEQKLKAGFALKYHMSIGQYTTALRMTIAENLLSTTELSIAEIAKKVGYNHSGNFIKSFKRYHNKTPLSFRKHHL